MTRSFKEDQQLFEQHFRDSVSPTNRTIWKNAKKNKIEGSSLHLLKDRSGCRITELTHGNMNLLQEKLFEVPRISA